MKLLSVKLARSIWLFQTTDLNPRGRNLMPAAAAAAQRYGFVKMPELNSFVTSPLKLEFEGGAFVTSDGVPKYVSLTVHDDGVVADTRSSTSDSDLFLDDVLSWLASSFGLPHYGKLLVRKIYVSEVTVSFERELTIYGNKFAKFAASLKAGQAPGIAKQMEMTQLNFGSDPALGTPVTGVRVEREVGTPFGSNHYYSFAPTTTEDHFKFLEALEIAATPD